MLRKRNRRGDGGLRVVQLEGEQLGGMPLLESAGHLRGNSKVHAEALCGVHELVGPVCVSGEEK